MIITIIIVVVFKLEIGQPDLVVDTNIFPIREVFFSSDSSYRVNLMF